MVSEFVTVKAASGVVIWFVGLLCVRPARHIQALVVYKIFSFLSVGKIEGD